MITSHRLSILHRPKKPTSAIKNAENAEVEYEREQERIHAKAEKQAAHEERLRRSLYAMPEDMRRNQLELLKLHDQTLEAKLAQKREEAQEDASWSAQPDYVHTVDRSMPWTVPSQLLTAEEEVAARRAHQRAAAEANRVLAAEHSHKRWVDSLADRREAQQQMQDEATWFNYGATSERWIPPARRRHHISEYQEFEHSRAAPHIWNPENAHPRHMTDYRASEAVHGNPLQYSTSPEPGQAAPQATPKHMTDYRAYEAAHENPLQYSTEAPRQNPDRHHRQAFTEAPGHQPATSVDTGLATAPAKQAAAASLSQREYPWSWKT